MTQEFDRILWASGHFGKLINTDDPATIGPVVQNLVVMLAKDSFQRFVKYTEPMAVVALSRSTKFCPFSFYWAKLSIINGSHQPGDAWVAAWREMIKNGSVCTICDSLHKEGALTERYICS